MYLAVSMSLVRSAAGLTAVVINILTSACAWRAGRRAHAGGLLERYVQGFADRCPMGQPGLVIGQEGVPAGSCTQRARGLASASMRRSFLKALTSEIDCSLVTLVPHRIWLPEEDLCS